MTPTDFSPSTTTYRDRRSTVVARWLMVVATLAVSYGLVFGHHHRDPAPAPAPVSSVSERIEEDDPRWDCRTMGNGLCGPNSSVSPVAPFKVSTSQGGVSLVDATGSAWWFPSESVTACDNDPRGADACLGY